MEFIQRIQPSKNAVIVEYLNLEGKVTPVISIECLDGEALPMLKKKAEAIKNFILK